jgi:hypothetical protein
VIGPFHQRLSTAIRAIDSGSVLFLDGGDPRQVLRPRGDREDVPATHRVHAPPVRRSGSGSSARSTPPTRRRTPPATSCRATSWTSAASTTRARPSGPTRTSTSRAWCTRAREPLPETHPAVPRQEPTSRRRLWDGNDTGVCHVLVRPSNSSPRSSPTTAPTRGANASGSTSSSASTSARRDQITGRLA